MYFGLPLVAMPQQYQCTCTPVQLNDLMGVRVSINSFDWTVWVFACTVHKRMAEYKTKTYRLDVEVMKAWDKLRKQYGSYNKALRALLLIESRRNGKPKGK